MFIPFCFDFKIDILFAYMYVLQFEREEGMGGGEGTYYEMGGEEGEVYNGSRISIAGV